MINELYVYACPKLSSEIKRSSYISFILGTALYSSLSLIFGNIILGIVITALYLGLSFLTFLDKDFKSLYMKLIILCIADIFVISTYMFSIVFPNYNVFSWSIILGIVFSILYEIVVFIKIKKSLYSSPSKDKKATTIIYALASLISTLIFGFLGKIPAFQNLVVFILILLCAATLLGGIMSIQKLIIYWITRNKISENCNDGVKQPNEIDKNN